MSSTRKAYAPPGEYVKDHTIFRWQERWHLLSISGRRGESWPIVGNEECFSHSISEDLLRWTFVGHTLEAGKPPAQDADMVWAPYVIEPLADADTVTVLYTACRQPNRGRPDFQANATREIRIATSTDLRYWRPQATSRRIPGKDPHVLKLPDGFAVYCMDGEYPGMTAYFTADLSEFGEPIPAYSDAPADLRGWNIYESPSVLYYEPWGRYILFLNLGYAVSDSPWRFTGFQEYKTDAPAIADNLAAEEPYHHPRLGFAREVFRDPTRSDRVLSTSCFGPAAHWKLVLFSVHFGSERSIELQRL